MSQQSFTLRKSVRAVAQRKYLIGIVTLAALLIGLITSLLRPPFMTSTALVVLPQNAPNVSTEVVIAGSEPVLSRALPKIHPAISLQTLQGQLHVKNLTSNVISISTQARSGEQAEQAANAVANAYIAYVGRPFKTPTPVGNVAVQVLQPATTATGTGALAQDVLDVVLGALAGLLAGAVTAILLGRRERTLSRLDDIANSIGVPVLAAVPVGRPADAAGWTRLINDYQPGPVEAWRLRQALREIGISETTANQRDTVTVTVLSMSSDPRALALGPQLAAYSASLAIPTLLIVGPQQDSNAAASLYTACAAGEGSPLRSPHLHTAATDTVDADVSPDARLVIVVAVVDGKKPKLPVALPTQVTMLGVAAGASTPEQLAMAASAAAAVGSDVTGLLVADPDPADETTGRIPRSVRNVRRLPSGGREQNLPVRPAQASSAPASRPNRPLNGLVSP
jgi:capsular polysaccharide biosynthesis protein